MPAVGAELRSQELIVGSLAGVATIAVASSLAQGEMPGGRIVLGTAFAGLGLATVNMFAPELAGSFAVLMLVSAVFLYGGPALDAVTSLTTSPAPQRPKPSKKESPK